jgi:hypothetical protein
MNSRIPILKWSILTLNPDNQTLIQTILPVSIWDSSILSQDNSDSCQSCKSETQQSKNISDMLVGLLPNDISFWLCCTGFAIMIRVCSVTSRGGSRSEMIEYQERQQEKPD